MFWSTGQARARDKVVCPWCCASYGKGNIRVTVYNDVDSFFFFVILGLLHCRDVELSRLLRDRATELNPHILRRILSGAARPDDFHRSPRVINGIEAGEFLPRDST